MGVGLSAQRAELVTSQGGSAEQATDWVRSNGNSRTRCVDVYGDGVCAPGASLGDYYLYSSDFDTLELNLGWRYDSRNRAIFADRGARHRFNIGYTVPGSDVEFWTASYDYLQFIPIWRSLTLMFNVELAYGEALGDTTALPPYRQYFGGGPDSVRGFRESRLGPKDNFGRPVRRQHQDHRADRIAAADAGKVA